MRPTLRPLLAATALALAVPSSASAQDAQGYVEGLISQVLSSNGRLVEITGLDVGFTGDVEVARIQLQDSEGPWLVIEGLELDWSPLSLLRDQVEIDLVAARSITVARTPFATPSAEAAGDPTELIAARVEELRVDELRLGEALVGQDVALTLSGSADLNRDPATIVAQLQATRTDAIEASLTADVTIDQTSGAVDVDLALSEAPGGVISELLPLRGEPRIDLALQASGTFADLAATLALQLDGADVVSGTATVAGTPTGRRITTDLDAQLTALLPDGIDPLFAGTSTLDVDLIVDGTLARIAEARIVSEVADIEASGTLDLSGPDTDAALTVRLGPQEGEPLRIEDTGAGPLTLDAVALDARVTGPLGRPQWRVNLSGDALEISGLSLADFSLDADGEGAAPSPASPLDIALRAEGQLQAAERLGIPGAAQGDVAIDTTLSIASLDDIAIEALALSTDALELEANGSVSPQSLGFDLAFDLSARSPQTGIAIADALLAGDVTASGRALRDPATEALLFDGVALTSDVVTVSLDGQGNAQGLDIDAEVALNDLSALSPQAQGSARLSANVSGTMTAPRLDLDASGDDVVLAGQAFTDPVLRVDATLDPQAPDGDIAFTGRLGGETVDVTARIETDEAGVRRLTDLDARIASARLTGDLALPREGAPTGTLLLDAPDLEPIGPLALTELAGALRAEIALGADETAALTLQGSDLAAAGAVIGSVEADIAVERWLDQPRPEGRAAVRDIAVGGLAVPTLDITFSQTGADAFATTLTAEAEGIAIAAEAAVTFEEDATRVDLTTLELDGRGLDTELAGPATLVLGQDATRIEDAVLLLGGGRVSVSGLVSPRLDLELGLDAVSLAIADAFAPDLELTGLVNGRATVVGDAANPEASFDVAVLDVTARPLADLSVPPLTLQASGGYAAGRIDAQADLTAANGAPISFTGDALAAEGLRARLTLLGEPASAAWTAAVTADVLTTAGVRAEALDLTLNGTGLAIGEDTPLLLDLDGSARLSGDPLPPALTGDLVLAATASIPTLERILIQRAEARVDETRLTLSGRANALAPSFDLTIDGDAASPETGIAALDGLLRGDVDVSGGLEGDVAAETYTLDNLRLASPALDIALDGTVTAETVDLTATGTLADLSSVSEQASGRIALDAALTGARAAPDFTATVTGSSVTLAGTRLTDPRLEASGTLDPNALAADAVLTGALGGETIDARVTLTTTEDGTRRLDGIDARIGGARLTGDLALPAEGAPTGAVSLDIPSLATIAPLLLTDADAASGSLRADVRLSETGGEAIADVTAEGRGIVFGDIRAARLDADLTVSRLSGCAPARGRGDRAGRDGRRPYLLGHRPDRAPDRRGPLRRGARRRWPGGLARSRRCPHSR